MHVDGGVTANVLIVPEAILVSGTPLFPPEARPKVYIIMNGKLSPDFEVVRASTLPIGRARSRTSVRANTRNTLLASLNSPRAGIGSSISPRLIRNYPKSSSIGFDAAYMGQLFDYGYQTRTSRNALSNRRRRSSERRRRAWRALMSPLPALPLP